MRILAAAFLGLGLSLAACAEVEPEAQTENIQEPGRYEVTPAVAPEIAFLPSVTHAGNYTHGTATFRVFELYEDNRIEVAIAKSDGKRTTVWNLTEAFGKGIDEIEGIDESENALRLRVYEAGAKVAQYRVHLDSKGALSVERSVFPSYEASTPTATRSHRIAPTNDPRYAALPSYQKTTIVNFEQPTVGSARIMQLEASGGSRVYVSLHLANKPATVYDTRVIVKDITAAHEIEPGYFDMQIIPVDENGGFDAIGIDFEPGDANVIIDLKHGVG